MTEELKRCDFCGGGDIASVPAEDDPDYDADYTVVAACMSCGARGPDGEFTAGAEAIAAWNTRAPVKVRQLEWKVFGTMAHIADAPLFGRLRVEPFGKDDTWTVCFSVPGYSDKFIEAEWQTPDEAKAAAQADYERRIREALE